MPNHWKIVVALTPDLCPFWTTLLRNSHLDTINDQNNRTMGMSAIKSLLRERFIKYPKTKAILCRKKMADRHVRTAFTVELMNV